MHLRNHQYYKMMWRHASKDCNRSLRRKVKMALRSGEIDSMPSMKQLSHEVYMEYKYY